MKLTNEAIELLNANNTAKGRLADSNNKHFVSVERWIEKNDDNGPLTTVHNLTIISEEIGIAKSKLLAA